MEEYKIQDNWGIEEEEESLLSFKMNELMEKSVSRSKNKENSCVLESQLVVLLKYIE